MASDNFIISEIKNGNNILTEKTYNKYRNEFIKWSRRSFNCDEEEAKEAYQNSFIIFYQKIISNELVEIKSSIKSYLFTIGKYKLHEDYRFKQKKVNEIKDVVPEDTDELYEQKEQQYLKVEKGLHELGDPCKSILILSFFKKKSNEEISEELGYKNSDTTKNLKYKCLKRLKKIVETLNLRVSTNE